MFWNSRLSATHLFLVLFFLFGIDNGIAQEQEECDFGPNALTSNYFKDIPQTCIEVPMENNADGLSGIMERCYYRYIPESCKDKEDLPLVFDIHGFGSCPLVSAFYTGWMQKAEKECFVVVWPSGTRNEVAELGLALGVGRGTFPGGCFNVPGFLESDEYGITEDGNSISTTPCCCNEEAFVASKDPNDPLFLKMAIDQVVEDIPAIDRSRIYMAGHSNGCVASLAMAALYSDTIAAVCCHAGSIITPFPEDYNAVPIWMAHGTEDDTVPFEGADDGNGFGAWSLNQAVDYIGAKNGCMEKTEIDLEENDASMVVQSNCNGGANVELLVLPGVNHFPYKWEPIVQMLMGEAMSEGTISIDTTALAWEFCSRHTLGGDSPTIENETIASNSHDENTTTSMDETPASMDESTASTNETTASVDENKAASSAPRNGLDMCLLFTMFLGIWLVASSPASLK